VPDLQPHALADFLVGKVFIEAKPNDLAAPLIERFQDQPHQPDAFPARDLFVRHRL